MTSVRSRAYATNRYAFTIYDDVMDIGALIFPTDKTIRPDRLGTALEERGYDSLWVAEHTHIPLARKTPYQPEAKRLISISRRWTRSLRFRWLQQ